MATNNVACIGQRSACVVRVTRLGADCSPVTGSGDNAAVLTGFVTGTTTPEVEEGTEFAPKDACGRTAFVARDPDVIKRWTLDLEFIFWDFEGIELMTDSTLLLGKASGGAWPGKAVGIETPGPQTVQGNGVGLEIWTKTATGQGQCGPASTTPPYVRHVFPRAVLRLNDRSFENDVANLKVTGSAETNVSWGAGPWGDWQPSTPASGNTPYLFFYDPAIPTGQCGYVSIP